MIEGKIEGKLVLQDDRYDLARTSLALARLALREKEIVTLSDLRSTLEDVDEIVMCDECPCSDYISRSIITTCFRKGRARLRRRIDHVSEIASSAIYSPSQDELHIPHLSAIRRVKKLKGLAMKLAEAAFRQRFYFRDRGIEILYRKMYIGVPDLIRCINRLPVVLDIKLQSDAMHVLVEFPENIFRSVAKRVIKRLLTPNGLLIQSMDLAAQLATIDRIRNKWKREGARDVLDVVGVFASRFLRKIARRDVIEMLEKWIYESGLGDMITIVFFDKKGDIKVIGRDQERFEYLAVRYSPRAIAALIPGVDLVAGERIYIFWHTEAKRTGQVR